MKKFLLLVAVFSSFLSIFFPETVQARSRIIDDVEIVQRQNETEIHLFFNFLLQYTAHTPQGAGDFLQIEMRPVTTPGATVTDLLTNENVAWAPTPELPLYEITYEGESAFSISDFQDPANRLSFKDIDAVIKLRFQEQVRFSIEASPDLRSMVIFIPKKVTLYPGKEKKIVKKEPAPPTEKKFTDLYAVNLQSTPAAVEKDQLPQHELFESQQLYSATAEIDGKTWYRWRLGFFKTKAEAEQAAAQLQSLYPEAWVVEVSQEERAQQAEEEAEPARAFVEREIRPLSPERLSSLLEEAEKEMTAENYQRAIQLYSRILQHPDPVHQQKALELLGLARERRGQLAHAKALYEEYLFKYPDSDGAIRVRQRLTGMLTARAQPKEALRKARAVPPGNQWEKEFFGSIAQFYQYDESKTDGVRSENLNSLLSDADIKYRVRNETYDIQAAFVGSNENDFTEDRDDEARVSSLYFDFLDKKNGLYGRLGRQSIHTGGVLGRFDGAHASYQITPVIKINGVFGYPVESSRITRVDKSKHFYGVFFDFGTFAERWDYNLFFIEQEVDDMIDRRAVGGEIRYFQPNLSMFSLLDYDIFYDTINTLLLVGNWNVTDRTTLNMQADIRRTPIQTTSNALASNPFNVETIEALKAFFTEDEIIRLAEHRTAKTKSLLLSATHTLNPNWQIYSDLTYTNTGDTDASAGVAAIPGTGDEYYANLQFIGNGLYKEGDLAIFGLRYSDASTRNSTAFTLNTRYPVTRNFRVSPRFIVEYRRDDDGSGDRTKFNPSLRFDYRFKKNLRLELEGGSDHIRDVNNGVATKTNRYYIILSYRILF